jgi:hypothetical protein
MDIKKEVTETLRKALIHCSKKYSIGILELRLRVFSKDETGNPAYGLMNKTENTCALTLEQDVLNIGSFDVIGKMKAAAIQGKMKDLIAKLAKQNSCKVSEVEARIFTRSESAEPSLYLFINLKPLRELSISELVE